MPLQCRYILNNVWHASIATYNFIFQKCGDSELYRLKIKTYFTWLKHGIIWNMSYLCEHMQFGKFLYFLSLEVLFSLCFEIVLYQKLNLVIINGVFVMIIFTDYDSQDSDNSHNIYW